MSKENSSRDSHTKGKNGDDDLNEYEEMELLERLETLREDMEELEVTTLEEVIQRIEALHRELDSR